MGYYMDQRESHFKIKKENFDAALTALKSVFVTENMTCCDWVNGNEIPHFAWVDTKRVLDAETLDEALEEIRWEPEHDLDGNIDCLRFDGEKIGDEDTFFQAIAPYVEAESYIEMIGEDNYMWRWVFNGDIVEEKTPTIIWN